MSYTRKKTALWREWPRQPLPFGPWVDPLPEEPGSPFAPGDYGTCILWLKGDDAPSGSIATWPFDTYGSNAAQASAAARPTRADGALNGHHAVVSDGSQWMSFTDASIRTLFIVMKHNTGTQDYGHYFGKDDNSAVHGGPGTDLHYDSPSPSNFKNGTVFLNGASAAFLTIQKPTTYKLVSLVATPSAVSFNRIFTTNGNEVGAPARIGNFSIAMVLGYSDALSDGNREAVEDAIGETYGLSITH